MNKLFGASKKKEAPKPQSNPNAPTLTETSNKLGERSDVLQKKVDGLN